MNCSRFDNRQQLTFPQVQSKTISQSLSGDFVFKIQHLPCSDMVDMR